MSRRLIVTLLLSAACWCAGATAAPAQQRPALPPVDSSRIIRLDLAGGEEFIGRVVAVTDSLVVLVSTGGLRVEVPRRLVRGWRPMQGDVVAGGAFRPRDPNTSRLFFAATGRTLRGGEGYFADYYLFFPFVAFGITDRLTVAAGVSIIPGASSQLVYIAPELGLYQSDNLNIAVGGIHASIPGEAESVSAIYGGFTAGSEDNAVTLMGGLGFGDGGSTPGIIAGFETRVGAGTKIIGEAWIFPEMDDLVVPIVIGPRFFGRRVSVDFGLAYFVGTETQGWPFIPWVDFVVNF